MSLTQRLRETEKTWLANAEDTDEWYEEGINLYQQLLRIDHFNHADYNKKLANLMLEKARNEKMLHGNMLTAERLLKKVIDIEPDHSEIYYRLAFINAHNKKWEAVLFYANEAIEQGILLDEEIKLSALMGCAYTQIGLKRRGKEHFEHAQTLDVDKKWSLFIENYKDFASQKGSLKREEREKKEVTIETTLQKVHENLCCILSLYSNRNVLITSKDDIALSWKEAELLAFLVQNISQPVSSSDILGHIWPELAFDNPNSTVVKRNISSLRSKIKVAFETDPTREWIPFEQNGYRLKIPVEVVIFKGVDFTRLSCR